MEEKTQIISFEVSTKKKQGESVSMAPLFVFVHQHTKPINVNETVI